MVWLGLSVLKISKIVIYENPEIQRKNKIILYGNRLIVYINTEDIHVEIVEDVETISDTSNYKLERPYLKERYLE